MRKASAAFLSMRGERAAHVRVILGMLTKLLAITSPEAHYDPHSFAIGSAALFGAACGAIGLLISRIRVLRAELRDLGREVEDLADRNWELKETEERARSLL